jgi:hypothetical protein
VRPTVALACLAAAACVALCSFTPAAFAQEQTQPAPAACDSLKLADFSGVQDAPTRVMESSLVAAAGEIPAACLVRGYVWPQVGFEMKLPAANWNGKLLELGSGGFAGSTQVTGEKQLCDEAVRRGYVCIHSDEGHTSGITERAPSYGDALWGYGNLEAKLDYGYRAEHVVMLAEKAIAARYYGGAAAKHVYFFGCSGGGRQALVAAQRFPWDFDGIVAMEPAIDLTGAFTDFLYNIKAVTDASGKPPGKSLFTPADLELLHQAAVSACDADDGLKDGVIGNPPACRFDPATVQCGDGQQTGCLTPAQVAAARKVYAGPVTSQGKTFMRGHTMPGGEKGGFGFGSANPIIVSGVTDFFRYLAFMPEAGPDWKPADFDFDADYQRESVMEGLYASDNPDLRRFQQAGGKLIIVQGWADGGSPFPLRTADYYETLEKVMGGAKQTQDFARLFMVPGREHCGGGDGASGADFLNSLEGWVERDQAPDLIKAWHVDHPASGIDLLREPADPAAIKFTRPLYPYPAWAKYRGSGDPNDYRSFKPVGAER